MAARRFNPKRKIAPVSDSALLGSLAARVKYTGNPGHKRNPGNFGLTPPSSPRPDKTLCDGANISQREVAQQLLREGVRRGLISTQERSGFPQLIWAVSQNGIALEAQLENETLGTYHGYPMQRTDPLSSEVLRRWQEDHQ